MDNSRQAGFDMGLFYAACENRVNPKDVHKTLAADEVLENHYRKKAHTKLMSSVYKIMDSVGRGHTKTARHIRALTLVDRETSNHTKKASDLVFDVVRRHEVMEKLATSPLLAPLAVASGAIGPILSAALITTLATSAAVGAAGGGAYFAGKRDIEEDEAENEAKKRRISYYKELTDDLESRFQREDLG